MKLAFSTIGCPDYTWTDIYPMAKDLGFDGIEIRGVAGIASPPTAQPFIPRQRARTKALLDRLEIQISCFSTSCELGTEEGRQQSLSEVADYLELAGDMGTPFVRVLLAGGYASHGASAGAFCGIWHSAASRSNWSCAVLPVLKNP